MKIELNAIQIKNIIEFLKRTSLKGSEVPAYVEVINILSDALNKVEK